jgi:hypothetical protein
MINSTVRFLALGGAAGATAGCRVERLLVDCCRSAFFLNALAFRGLLLRKISIGAYSAGGNFLI